MKIIQEAEENENQRNLYRLKKEEMMLQSDGSQERVCCQKTSEQQDSM